ncbi:MAG: hypothetical protein H7X79_01035 [Sporomusaceae bacterium]|nr:hypothetical protein [Sporomusaceae bacterium]
MKKVLIIIIALSVLMMMSVTASARDRGRDDHDKNRQGIHHKNGHKSQHNQRYDDDRNWRNTHREDHDSVRHLSFKWYDHYDSIQERYVMERIHDGEWEHRFPGVHGRRWHGNNGFWHHGHYVTDAVFFFNDDNRLVSIGYMSNGVFIHFREDHESYENYDSFFFSWWHR